MTWISVVGVVWGQSLTAKITENQRCLLGLTSSSADICQTDSMQSCYSARCLPRVLHIPSLSCLTKSQLLQKIPALYHIFEWQRGAGATAQPSEWS